MKCDHMDMKSIDCMFSFKEKQKQNDSITNYIYTDDFLSLGVNVLIIPARHGFRIRNKENAWNDWYKQKISFKTISNHLVCSFVRIFIHSFQTHT